MPMRDRLVLGVLVGGFLAALAAWHLLEVWPAMVLGVLTVLVAGVVYRIEPPRIRFGHWPPENAAGLVHHEAHEPEQDRVGQ